jgi:AAA15 family ATPase/GTPase
MPDLRAMKLLDFLDTGIKSINIDHESLVDQYQRLGVSLSDQKLTEMFGRDFTIKDAAEIRFTKVSIGHTARNGDIESFDIKDESTGTVRLLFILGPIFKALDSGSIVIIDEIDSSLHTLACEQIIALFQSPKTNPKGAQLIATTHDTNLLNPDTLRRDQIWFTEKDGEGATYLYPLTDIHTRKGDNIEKGYLQGRFGAVPFAGSVDDFIKMD